MQFQQFKKLFPDLSTPVNFFTDDCEQVNFIDTDCNLVEFTTSVTARCGCCSETISHSGELNHFIDNLSESDFNELIELLKTK